MILEDKDAWLAKAVGSFCGVLISLVMIAPEGTKNALYRVVLGFVSGVIFSPTVMSLFPWFRGDTIEHHLAAGTLAGFSVWFVLEGLARILSSRKTLQRLIEEMLRIRNEGATKVTKVKRVDTNGGVEVIKVETHPFNKQEGEADDIG